MTSQPTDATDRPDDAGLPLLFSGALILFLLTPATMGVVGEGGWFAVAVGAAELILAASVQVRGGRVLRLIVGLFGAATVIAGLLSR